jgi:hypothetical protein
MTRVVAGSLPWTARREEGRRGVGRRRRVALAPRLGHGGRRADNPLHRPRPSLTPRPTQASQQRWHPQAHLQRRWAPP